MKNITNSLEAAFGIYGKHIKSYLLAFLTILGVILGTTFLSLFVLFGRNTINTLTYLVANPQGADGILSGMEPVSIVLSVLIALTGFAVAYALLGGVIGFTDKFIKKKKINALDHMFTVAKTKGPILIAARLLSLAFYVVAFCASLIVAFFVSMFLPSSYAMTAFFTVGLLSLLLIKTLFLMVDQAVIVDNVRPWTALNHAYLFAKKNFLNLLIIIILFGVASHLVGFLPLGSLVNFLLIAPIEYITYTFFYIKNK